MRLVPKVILFCLAAFSATSVHAQIDFCDVYGSIYLTSTKNRADYTVYVEDSEAFTEILVFEEENELFADQQGKWYMVTDQSFADFRIYITKNRREADFTIYYTDTESFAGCNN